MKSNNFYNGVADFIKSIKDEANETNKKNKISDFCNEFLSNLDEDGKLKGETLSWNGYKAAIKNILDKSPGLLDGLPESQKYLINIYILKEATSAAPNNKVGHFAPAAKTSESLILLKDDLFKLIGEKKYDEALAIINNPEENWLETRVLVDRHGGAMNLLLGCVGSPDGYSEEEKQKRKPLMIEIIKGLKGEDLSVTHYYLGGALGFLLKQGEYDVASLLMKKEGFYIDQPDNSVELLLKLEDEDVLRGLNETKVREGKLEDNKWVVKDYKYTEYLTEEINHYEEVHIKYPEVGHDKRAQNYQKIVEKIKKAVASRDVAHDAAKSSYTISKTPPDLTSVANEGESPQRPAIPNTIAQKAAALSPAPKKPGSSWAVNRLDPKSLLPGQPGYVKRVARDIFNGGKKGPSI